NALKETQDAVTQGACGDELADGFEQGLLAEGGGLGGEALVKGLSGDAEVESEVLEGGFGVVQPAEDKGLQELGAGEAADAADEAGGVGQEVGADGEKAVQGGEDLD